MGSNSGTLWAISATQKPTAPALSLAQTQRAPSPHPAAATCSPHTGDECLARGAWGDTVLAGAGSIRLLSYLGLCSIVALSNGALCLSWHEPGSSLRRTKRMIRHRKFIQLYEQKGCGDYTVLIQLKGCEKGKERNCLTAAVYWGPKYNNKLDNKGKKAEVRCFTCTFRWCGTRRDQAGYLMKRWGWPLMLLKKWLFCKHESCWIIRSVIFFSFPPQVCEKLFIYFSVSIWNISAVWLSHGLEAVF